MNECEITADRAFCLSQGCYQTYLRSSLQRHRSIIAKELERFLY